MNRTYGIKKREFVPFFHWLRKNGYKLDVLSGTEFFVLLTGRWYSVPEYGRLDPYVCAILHKAKKELHV